ncbi:c-type cytochrome [Variovorax sp. JS1663]|uniref:c-type cytochrome n=1 Tax=Variovorax sp. JS1663 TaxID=1851577 RepID=UPI000B342F35|nr:cytochrome c [Variovorax sp. JS1663]OUM01311.1 cytochrome C [Variovorax sp. JS1663]
MSLLPDTPWLNALIGLLQAAQLGLLRLLAWLGLAATSHGQPAWPWALRLSGENLLIDLGQARRAALTLGVLCAALIVLLLALLWRRRRLLLIACVPLLLALAPWPDAQVLLVPAHPTSFHHSPSGFTAASIARGQALYASHCVSCHGADGRGRGPLAAAQAVWPPSFGGPLLWNRADGDLLWRVLHGMQNRRGMPTMPAFRDRLDERDAWALIDFMKALGAGQSLLATGLWARPIGLPDVTVRCEDRPPRGLASWRGQRLRIVAAGATAAPLEDPRLVTVRLRPPGETPGSPPAGCTADAEAWQAFALIAGTEQLAGVQLLADREGWLRARNAPGQAGWSEEDLLCRAEASPGKPAAAVDGLSALIARMDAEPVRFVKGGFVH